MNRRTILGILGILLIIFMVGTFKQLVTNVDANEIVICQFPTGSLAYWTSPGWHARWFGKVTSYPKSAQYWFSSKIDQGKPVDQSIHTRFQDAGTATISGGVRYDMPLDEANLKLINEQFGSSEAVEKQLIGPVLERAVFMSGPLMSSRQALSTSSARFLGYIEDQAKNGVYQKRQIGVVKKNETGQDETVMIDSIVQDEKSPHGYARIEASPLSTYKINLYNVVINNINPDAKVAEQISKQQSIEMAIQTSIAEMNMASQKAETVKKEGEANAAKSKWEQETIKIKEVTKADQEKQVAETKAKQEFNVAKIQAERELQVAQLQRQAAVELKEKLISEGQGEATKKKLILEADNALAQRLDAWVTVNSQYAAAISNYKGNWVPGVIMGSTSGTQPASGANDLIDLLKVQTAKQIGLDTNFGPGKK